ncbi:MAG: CDP-diacylglycerol--serine O-phosphatidyltransferase [bacterium]|nr:CDP-diacylglycerol--serine O-phosphatidyltransferase [bacterium]
MKKQNTKKGIYILPSLFTLGNLSLGFLSIIMTNNARFTTAAWYILFAGVCDILDGLIAKLTNTTSQFGAELDSLADLVTFGIAPAILIYQFTLFKLPKWGIIIALLYIIAAALRLARFNTKKGEESQYCFKGLPSPAAAGILVTFVLINLTTQRTPVIAKYLDLFIKVWPLIVILVAYAMISNLSYFAIKNLKLKKPKTIRFIVLLGIGGVLIWRFPENMLFTIFLLYFLSGSIDLIRKLNRATIIFKNRKK